MTDPTTIAMRRAIEDALRPKSIAKRCVYCKSKMWAGVKRDVCWPCLRDRLVAINLQREELN